MTFLAWFLLLLLGQMSAHCDVVLVFGYTAFEFGGFGFDLLLLLGTTATKKAAGYASPNTPAKPLLHSTQQ
jgi:hypothetical protein